MLEQFFLTLSPQESTRQSFKEDLGDTYKMFGEKFEITLYDSVNREYLKDYI